MGLSLWSCDKCENAFTEHEDSVLCQKCRKEYCEDYQSRYDIVQSYKCCVCKHNVDEEYEGEHIDCFWDRNPKHSCDDSSCLFALYPAFEDEDQIVDALKKERVNSIKCDYCDYSKRWVHNETNEVMK
jgi:hypothetical protein